MNEGIDLFVGIDLGASSHRVCVLDRERNVADEWNVEHDGESIASSIKRLLSLAEAAKIVVAVESRWSSIVEALQEQQVRVFCVNPKRLDRFRDRHTTAGAKDDRRDAFVLADSLRTDDHAFREIRFGDARLIELRELSRMHDELSNDLAQTANRLYQQLLRVFPQVLELGSIYDDRWILALLERVPTPDQLPSLDLESLRSLLRTSRIRRWTAERVAEVLRKTPLVVAPGVRTAARLHILTLLPRLTLLHSQLAETDRALERLLEDLARPDQPNKKEHRDVTILLSLPGAGTIVCATMLAEAHEALAARDYQHLRSLAGSAPVTHQSGKTKRVAMRRACNGRLRNALFYLARTLIQHDPKSKALYAAHRARGHHTGHALRVVADRALAMLIAMLRDGFEYNPSRRAMSVVSMN